MCTNTERFETKCEVWFQFRIECKLFLAAVTKKILDWGPLKSSMVRNLSSLDPRPMCSKPDQCVVGLRRCGTSWPWQEDWATANKNVYWQNTLNYRKSLSTCLRGALAGNPSYKELWKAVRLLLVLSHGQASVEWGFSVHSQTSVENLKGLSYISQRIICDAVGRASGIFNVPISKELRVAVSAVRQHYGEHLKSQMVQCR